MNYSRYILIAIGLAVSLVAVGCSGGGGDDGGSGGGSTPQTNWNGIGVQPSPDWHRQYQVGRHASMDCNSCHQTARSIMFTENSRDVPGAQICLNCHVDQYNRTRFLNHATAQTGTYCNSCHYSDSFTSHTRISHTTFHNGIKNSCETCHTSRAPASHNNGRKTGCDTCHQYSSGRWSLSGGGGAHTHATGCANCHVGKAPASHNDGRKVNCENCHKYPKWSNISGGAHNHTTGCSNCHAATAPQKHFGATCENCHKYPKWSGVTFSHQGITSDCASCHSRHFAGYNCEWCHTFGISWRYSHSQVKSQACRACHGSDNPDDDDDDHDDDDDDDDDD